MREAYLLYSVTIEDRNCDSNRHQGDEATAESIGITAGNIRIGINVSTIMLPLYFSSVNFTDITLHHCLPAASFRQSLPAGACSRLGIRIASSTANPGGCNAVGMFVVARY